MGNCGGKTKEDPKKQGKAPRDKKLVGKKRSYSFDSDSPPTKGTGLSCHGCRAPLGKTRVMFEGKELCHSCFQSGARKKPAPAVAAQREYYQHEPYNQEYYGQTKQKGHGNHHQRAAFTHGAYDAALYGPENGYFDYTRTAKNDAEYNQ
eukprot:TRINITY_DN22892_c0_g1_i1.p2 TRINITY_DN22892_c0_g1~~TRINITY_DN22892_c0_g1_i1.p2  ORF type:complete len:149 (+),score=33.79 TRINITY_DN22892_c0_g1_i1:77-523(+)